MSPGSRSLVFWGQVHTPTAGYGNDTSKEASEKPQCRRGSVLPSVLWGERGRGGSEVERRHVYKGSQAFWEKLRAPEFRKPVEG